MLRFLKKQFVLLLSAMLITAACSGGEAKLNPANPVTTVIWHYYHGAQKTAFDAAVKEFNETLGYEKGIIVEAVSHGGVSELAENVKSASAGELDAGNMPDIFGSYGDTALEVLKMGKTAAINDYLSQDRINEYYEPFIVEGMIGTDSLYVFPIAKSTESLMLNKTDFDAFVKGLENSTVKERVSYDDLSTWEGILRVADIYYRYTKSISSTGEGKAFMGLDSVANYLIVGSKQLGQDLIDTNDNGEVEIRLDKDIMTKLWFTYYEPMVTGRFIKLGKFCSDDVKTGDSLCFIGSTTSASYFPTELLSENDETREIEMLVLPMPYFEGGDKVAVSQGAGMVISKSAPLMEQASAIFLEWFTEEERNVGFSLSSSYLPVKKNALDEKLVNAFFDSVGGDAGAQNSVKALKVGLEQLKTYNMYSSRVFDGSADFRVLLPKDLETAVREDREEYLLMIENGFSPEEAYDTLFNRCDAKIDQWLESLRLK